MSAPRRPIVGFDGSPSAYAALRQAASLTRQNHGLLTVLLVLSTDPWSASSCPFAPALPPSYDPQKAAADELREAIDDLSQDISVVSLIAHGRVGPALLHAAQRHRCDAIVIGARCGVLSRITGGVERYLRAHSQLQVMVAKAPRPEAGLSSLSQLAPRVPAAPAARPA